MTAKKGVPRSVSGRLRDVVVSRVQPSSISEHPEFLFPSVYDMVQMDIYMPSVSLYRLDTVDPSAFSTFIDGVKNSLSQVLSLYYPMAGKWIVTQDAWIRKLYCNDEGAVFVEAAIDEEMDKVLDRNDLNVPEELTGEHAVPGFEYTARHKTSDTNEFPSLIIQVQMWGSCPDSKLQSHDSGWLCFQSFSESLVRNRIHGSDPSKPFFDRSAVASHLQKSDITGITPDSRNLDDNLSVYFKSYNSAQSGNWKFIRKFFCISNDMVERLRHKANDKSVSDLLERPERFTTFECVAAQIWRCFARIPTVLSGMTSDKKVRIFCPVEGRRKWNNPSLPEDFVGNLSLVAATPEIPGSEIADKPLSFAASHMHRSVRKVNHQTSGELLDRRLNMAKEIKSIKEKPNMENPDNHGQATTLTVLINAWFRFDNCYNLDFGTGSPFSFFPCGSSSSVATVVYLLPPAPQSGNVIEMLIVGSSENLKALCEDSEFRDLVS